MDAEAKSSFCGDLGISSDIFNGHFMELIEQSCSGHSFALKVSEVLYHDKSEYQDIMIFKSETYGNVLALEGIINCTERDECSYQEMLTNLALCSHANPQSVLIIGGGDGGIAREVSRHSAVKRIVQCEIDQKVIDACKKYLPSMACGFDDQRMELFVGDGFAFMERHRSEFDVVITDSSDPIGPGEVLFRKQYYELLNRTLKPGGVLSSQVASMWIPAAQALYVGLMKDVREIFPVVRYAYTYTPSYTTGQIGILLASKDKDTKFEEPKRIFSEEEKNRMQLNYYNEDVHRSSFAYPTFIKKLLKTLQ